MADQDTWEKFAVERGFGLALCSGGLERKAVEAELARYYRAAAGAPSRKEADGFRNWLGGFPAACSRR